MNFPKELNALCKYNRTDLIKELVKCTKPEDAELLLTKNDLSKLEADDVFELPGGEIVKCHSVNSQGVLYIEDEQYCHVELFYGKNVKKNVSNCRTKYVDELNALCYYNYHHLSYELLECTSSTQAELLLVKNGLFKLKENDDFQLINGEIVKCYSVDREGVHYYKNGINYIKTLYGKKVDNVRTVTNDGTKKVTFALGHCLVQRNPLYPGYGNVVSVAPPELTVTVDMLTGHVTEQKSYSGGYQNYLRNHPANPNNNDTTDHRLDGVNRNFSHYRKI